RIPDRVHGKPVIAYRALIGSGLLREDVGRPESGCVIFTTSGTTKAPKFVLHDQRTVLRHAHDVALAFGYEAPDTRVLVTAPPCPSPLRAGACSASPVRWVRLLLPRRS